MGEIVEFPKLESVSLLFTYGTLMRGQLRHAVLEREIFEGEGYIRGGELFDTGHGFPALMLDRSGLVWGEVYRVVHPGVWVALDRIEAGLYGREVRKIWIPEKPPSLREQPAQVYVADAKVFAPQTLTRIPGGRWNNRADA
jgi:gamma-glutamylcyclotransferase (GGCT)/AIG2-like uncharacterized protein YtfP